jgi:hypothetical protein
VFKLRFVIGLNMLKCSNDVHCRSFFFSFLILQQNKPAPNVIIPDVSITNCDIAMLYVKVVPMSASLQDNVAIYKKTPITLTCFQQDAMQYRKYMVDK